MDTIDYYYGLLRTLVNYNQTTAAEFSRYPHSYPFLNASHEGIRTETTIYTRRMSASQLPHITEVGCAPYSRYNIFGLTSRLIDRFQFAFY